MKIRLLIVGILSGAFFLSSCDDDLKPVGGTIRPDEDGSNVQVDTFYIQAETLVMEGIYARTTTGMLGEMYDPLYGKLKSDYLTQFYCEEDFEFYYEPIGGKIDSVKVFLLYSSWYGDSIAPMVAEVYEITNDLQRNFYSNFDPTQYYDPQQGPLGTKAYTPRDFSRTDSAWNADIANSQYHVLGIDLPKELGQRIYDATLYNKEVFANQDAFNKFFKGLYITTNSNSTGNLLPVAETQIYMYYETEINTTTTAGKDTSFVRTWSDVLISTKEVIQLNRYENDEKQLNELTKDEKFAYIKSPGALYTKITVPTATSNLIDKIEGRTINSFQFSIKIAPENEWEDALTPPSLLMLIPEDSLGVHFENNRLIDDSSILSYGGTYVPSTRTYSFGNIANMITVQMKNDPENDLRMILVPVTTVTNSNKVVTDVYPVFTPSAAQIRKDDELREFTLISSRFNDE